MLEIGLSVEADSGRAHLFLYGLDREDGEERVLMNSVEMLDRLSGEKAFRESTGTVFLSDSSVTDPVAVVLRNKLFLSKHVLVLGLAYIYITRSDNPFGESRLPIYV